MSITNEEELEGMKKVSRAVAFTLKEMKNFTKPGITTKELDDFGAKILNELGANSAPYKTYNFPGYTCISVNKVLCHGIPSENVFLKEGDLINIDVSAELDGYWSDNGNSFIIGEDIHQHQKLVDASQEILQQAINNIKGGVKIADIGGLIEGEAKKRGFNVIKNLGGHGIGRSLHEQPDQLLNYRDRYDKRRFKKNSVVAIETFITSQSTQTIQLEDGWTMVGNKGGYMAQHEHTILITDGKPVILTEDNGIWE